MNSEQIEIFNGLMLGDGHLEKHKNGINACLRITRQITDKTYLLHHSKIFEQYSCYISEGAVFDKRTNKTYYNCKLKTKVSPELTKLRYKWYPDGKKIIPKDLELTPLTIATWFADDGHACCKPCRHYIKFATHGFTYEEVDFLKNQLMIFGLNPKIYKDKSGKKEAWFIILGNKSELKKFSKLIDAYLPPGMERKAVWRNNKFLKETIKPFCSNCNSNNTQLNGLDRDKKQKYKCKDCKRTFTQNARHRTLINQKIINDLKDLLNAGLKPSEICDRLNICRSTFDKLKSI